MAFGQRSLKPTTLAKGIKLSRKLLRVAPNSEELVTARLKRKVAVPMEKGYLTGNGANQPLGVFVASNDGIPTTRDVSTGNSTTAITFDGLTEVKYTLKPQYWANAKWLYHRDAIKMLAKIKNGDGNYVWRESVRVGEPDMLLGSPMAASEFAPNTFTTGKYVGIYGDFSFYWIADALGMELQRVMELYSKSRQIGLHAWLETDGMPVLTEAFVRVQLA
jgi:HK97 family phage major capsid protein